MAEVSARRIRVVRFVKGIPLLGAFLRRLYYAWRGVRDQWYTFKANRAFTVRAVTRRNTRAGYEKLFGSEELLDEYLGPERLRFYEEVANVCAGFAARRVVDIGCGSGHLLHALADRMPAARYVGVDYSENAIRRGRDLLPEARWLIGDAAAPPLEGNSFDLVLCTEVLEHLDRPRDVLEALARLCAPKGRIVVTVPDGELDGWEGHVNFWNESDLASFLAPVGDCEIRRVDGGRTLLAVISG
jgi:SAM-dependent methyltransferase